MLRFCEAIHLEIVMSQRQEDEQVTTQQDRTEDRSEAVIDRRDYPRYTVPPDRYVQVEFAFGGETQARVLDASPFGGACLIFRDDPRLEVGNIISVYRDGLPTNAEVRHAQKVSDEYRVGVRWTVA